MEIVNKTVLQCKVTMREKMYPGYGDQVLYFGIYCNGYRVPHFGIYHYGSSRDDYFLDPPHLGCNQRNGPETGSHDHRPSIFHLHGKHSCSCS